MDIELNMLAIYSWLKFPCTCGWAIIMLAEANPPAPIPIPPVLCL